MWDALFNLTNMVALTAWVTLIALPRKQFLLNMILYLGIGLLCAIYTALLISLLTGIVDPERSVPAGGMPSSYSVDSLLQLFGSRGGIVTGWTHYLALDLFAGWWIAQDADRRGAARLLQAPVLLLTFLAGPVGLLIWLIIRKHLRARQ